MRTRQLEYFIAVAEDLSFTRVAKRFFISQAALSQQIRSLESEIGAKLFDRDSHHVTLTHAGSTFLADARLIVEQSRKAIDRARLADNCPDGTLGVGYIKGYEQSNLSDMLFNFHQHNPHIRLEFLRDNVSELYDALRQEKVDVVINHMYDTESLRGMEYRQLRTWPLEAVVSASNPLADRASIALSELAGYPLIDIEKGSQDYGELDAIEKTLAAADIKPDVSYLSRDVETTSLAVAAGLGYALLPGYFTEGFKSFNKVVSLPLKGLENEISIVAAWLPSHQSKALSLFLDELLVTNDS